MANKHTKRCSILPLGNASRNYEMPHHTHWESYYKKLQKTKSVGGNVEKLELFAGNVKMVELLWKAV